MVTVHVLTLIIHLMELSSWHWGEVIPNLTLTCGTSHSEASTVLPGRSRLMLGWLSSYALEILGAFLGVKLRLKY